MYSKMGIERDDHAGRARASLRNFELFDAPHVAFIGMDEKFGTTVAIDVGMYGQNLMLAMTAPYLGFIAYYSSPPWAAIMSGYLGLLLLGASFMSVGVFVSTMTENQIISAGLSFAALLIFWVAAWTMDNKTGYLADIVNYLSIFKHFDQFAKGVVDTRDIFYYLSFIYIFLFLTLRSLESKKWRG